MVDTLSVFPTPCIDLTSGGQYCNNEDPEVEFVAPNRWLFAAMVHLKSRRQTHLDVLNLSFLKPALQVRLPGLSTQATRIPLKTNPSRALRERG